MPDTITCTAGAYRAVVLTLLDGDGNPVTTYTDAASLSASVWPGDDLAAAFNPVASWVDATQGTVSLTFLAAQTATLSPGRYPVQLTITADGKPRVETVATLAITPGPGTAAARAVYCTLDDMERAAGQMLKDFQEQADLAGFIDERADAREWCDGIILCRVERILRDQYRRHAPVAIVEPIVPTDGIDAGPWWGASTIPLTTLRDQLAAFRGYLAAGNLLLTSPLDRRIVKANALYAVGLVFQRQIGEAGAKSPYQDYAVDFLARANRMLFGCTFRLDTNADGVAEWEIR